MEFVEFEVEVESRSPMFSHGVKQAIVETDTPNAYDIAITSPI